MSHRFEAVEHTGGSWTVDEFMDTTVVNPTASPSKRDALFEAVRLNRHILRGERLRAVRSVRGH
jgi:hypothetical protein